MMSAKIKKNFKFEFKLNLSSKIPSKKYKEQNTKKIIKVFML